VGTIAGGRWRWAVSAHRIIRRKTLALSLRWQGKDDGLGEYPLVTLKDARERRFAARKMLAAGIDPMAERKAEAEAKQREAEARQREAANGGNSGLLASLRVTLTTCCGAWKRTSSQRWVTSTLTM
jgi:Arm DNA-binding domain